MNSVRKLSYRSDLGELQRLCGDVGVYCGEREIDPDTTLALTLCLDELFTNTLKYGYCADASVMGAAAASAQSGSAHAADPAVDRVVEIYLQRHTDRVTVCYCDRGQPFDPFDSALSLPDVAQLSPDALPTGGFGIHLLRKLCSEVSYVRKGDTNVVSLSFIWG